MKYRKIIIERGISKRNKGKYSHTSESIILRENSQYKIEINPILAEVEKTILEFH